VPEGPAYETTPDDLSRIERCHALVCAHPQEFSEAAAWLDRVYSAEAVVDRLRKQKERAAEIATTPPKPSRLDLSGLRRLILIDWVPDRFHRFTNKGWEERLRRWDLLLENVTEGLLPITLPSPSWEEVSRYPLIYWITCDKRAERGPKLSTFQEWAWTTGDVFERETARCFVKDWPKLNRAVDLALAVAASRGLVLAANESVSEELVTLDQAAAICGQSKRTLENWLQDKKIPRPDVQGGRGKASRWRWSRLLLPLEKESGRRLPRSPPFTRILPSN
jgi:predicted DNA-binding transcriptional regulator AlpA